MEICKKCKEIEIINYEANCKIERAWEEVNKHEHLINFGSSEDTFHAFEHYYFCPNCFNIYQLRISCAVYMKESEHTATFLRINDEIKDKNHYTIAMLEYYYKVHNEKKNTLNHLKQLNKPITVYKFISSSKWFEKESEMTKIKKQGYQKGLYKFESEAKIYLSLDDFFGNFPYGWQYFEDAHLISFEVDPNSIDVIIHEMRETLIGTPISNAIISPQDIMVIEPMNDIRIALLDYEPKHLDRSTDEFKRKFQWYEDKHKSYKDNEEEKLTSEQLREELFSKLIIPPHL